MSIISVPVRLRIDTDVINSSSQTVCCENNNFSKDGQRFLASKLLTCSPRWARRHWLYCHQRLRDNPVAVDIAYYVDCYVTFRKYDTAVRICFVTPISGTGSWLPPALPILRSCESQILATPLKDRTLTAAIMLLQDTARHKLAVVVVGSWGLE